MSASDNGSPSKSSRALAIIKILEAREQASENDTNSSPQFITESVTDKAFAVSENEMIGHIVTVLKTVDEDGDVLCTHLVAGNSDGAFAVHDGALVVAGRIDYERTTKYRLTLAVTDGLIYSYLNVSEPVHCVSGSPMCSQQCTASDCTCNTRKLERCLCVPSCLCCEINAAA